MSVKAYVCAWDEGLAGWMYYECGCLLWLYGLVGLSCIRRNRQWEMVSFERWYVLVQVRPSRGELHTPRPLGLRMRAASISHSLSISWFCSPIHLTLFCRCSVTDLLLRFLACTEELHFFLLYLRCALLYQWPPLSCIIFLYPFSSSM